MNFLTENKIEQYADLLTRIKEIATASEQAGDSLKEAEKRLSDMALLIKNVTTYQKTKPLYEAYRKGNVPVFKFILHDTFPPPATGVFLPYHSSICRQCFLPDREFPQSPCPSIR